MKRILIIFVFFLSSCGYQPLYLNNNIRVLKFKPKYSFRNLVKDMIESDLIEAKKKFVI